MLRLEMLLSLMRQSNLPIINISKPVHTCNNPFFSLSAMALQTCFHFIFDILNFITSISVILLSIFGAYQRRKLLFLSFSTKVYTLLYHLTTLKIPNEIISVNTTYTILIFVDVPSLLPPLPPPPSCSTFTDTFQS